MQLIKLKPKAALLNASITISLLLPFSANAASEGAQSNGGRGLEDGVNSLNSLIKAIGMTGHTASLALAVILFVIGGVLWGISSNKQGNNTATKSAASGFILAAIILGSITGFLSMGSNTITEQNSEVEAFLTTE